MISTTGSGVSSNASGVASGSVTTTGFASSGEFHFGHKAIIDLYLDLHKYTDKGYFVICDIDAYVSRPDSKISSLEKAKEYAVNNVANALASRIPEKDIVIQSKQDPEYFSLSHMISKKLTLNSLRSALGHEDLGKFSACYLQISDILYPQIKEGKTPTLIPMGIDQEPIIRLCRDVARKLRKQYDLELPSSIYISHVPSFRNIHKKMSKSKEGSEISLTEDEENIYRIVHKAFTGGRGTITEQREYGGTPEICPIYHFYKFHHPNDRFVNKIYKECRKGSLLCDNDKEFASEWITDTIKNHKKRYNKYLDKAYQLVFG